MFPHIQVLHTKKEKGRVGAGVPGLTYAQVCSRMLTYAKKKRKAAWALACLARGKNKVGILAGTYAHVCSRMLAYARRRPARARAGRSATSLHYLN
jgi:hypothetical protein